MTLKDIERVLYFENYIVTEPGLTSLKEHQLLSEEEYMVAVDEFGEDLHRDDRRRSHPRDSGLDGSAGSRANCAGARFHDVRTEAKKLMKRLKIVESFIDSGNRPGMDDHEGRAGDPAGPASAGSARWRPLRDLRPQRSLSPRDQP
jgi:DNA-directed RNA polymerase subunit beta'